MKQNLLLIFLMGLTSLWSNAQTQIDLPVTFDDTTVNYTMTDFGGNTSTVVVDPTNPSNMVGQADKSASAQLWAGTTMGDPIGTGFANAVPFLSSRTTMTVMVWSPDAGTPIRLKVEDAGNPTISVETEDTTTLAGAWEMLSFDFSNEVSGTAAINFANTYDKASIFFNFGTDGATAGAKTYYWDDVQFVEGGTNPVDLPVTFEDPNVAYGLTDFGGNVSSIVADPSNPANTVVQSDKTVTAQLWAGTTMTPNNSGFINPIPFSSGNTTMTVMIWSPDAGTPIRLKVEDVANPAISVETEDTTTMAGAWEMLTFDFSNEVAGTAAINFANTYDKASLFFNFGTDGATAGAKTYYWDDVQFGGGGGNPMLPVDLPITFEDTSVAYGFTDFGGNVSTIVADPTNPNNMVAQSDKTVSAQLWAGTTMTPNNMGFVNPIPFLSSRTTMTVMVWSPDAGTPIRLKVEDAANPAISVETEDTTTMAGAWEMLTFDFSNEVVGTAAINFANTYDKASIFFNFGTDGATAGAKTYYWDDVQFVEGGANPVDLPVTFEDPNIAYGLTDFGGNVSSIVADPSNPSNTVAQSDKTASAQLWAGTTMAPNNLGFVNPIPFSSGNTSMSVMVWSPDAGTPIRLKVEDAANPAISVETEDTTTLAGAWEMLTFDFSNEVSGTAAINFANTYDKASIFFNFGTDGATAGAKTYYWDDVQFVSGSGPVLSQIDLPVTFDDTTVNYTMTDFGGNTSAVVVDPTNASNMVGQADKSATAQLWAGTTMGDPIGTGFANAIPFTAANTTMTAMVWSPDAGTPIRLKVEDATNPTISVETEDTTTMAGAWEMLTFDFSNEAPGTAAINIANTYDKASIFFNFGTDGATAGAKTYYWDDVQFVSGSGPLLSQIDLPVTFDDSTVNYTMTDFGGNTSAVVVDPTNAANMVGQADKSATAQLWAGTTMGDTSGTGFANPVPFSAGNTIMTVMVYSPDAGTPIRLKVEDATNPTISVETEDTTTMAGAWEMLTFDFSNEAPGTAAINIANTYDKASIFFNFGTDGATAGAKTYYWDDVQFVSGSGPVLSQIDLPVTFDDTTVNYTMTDFGGNTSAVVVDPTNASNMVGQADKSATAQLWAGTTMGDTSGTGFANPVPFSAGNTIMTVMVYSPDAGTPIRLKVEDMNNPTISVETEDTTTMANAWEMLTFDFSNEAPGTAAINFANTYDKASIFFNFGTDGATAGAKTYYWDDVEFIGGGNPLSQIDLPVTFDDPLVNYTMTDFGGNQSSLVVDPMNSANTVGQAIKTSTAQTWAGTTMGDTSGTGFANAIPFSAGNTIMTLMVYSPDAGTPIRLKVEDMNNPTISVETEDTTTMANAWEMLTFDFSNEAPGTAAINFANTYDKASIFFNFGTDGATAGAKTYLWDDVQFGGGNPPLSQIDLPVTFDDPTVNYALTDFGGNASNLDVDPTNANNNVGKSIKTASAMTWAGTTMGENNNGFANAIPFTSSETKMSVRVYSPDAGTPVRLKVEDNSNPAISVETEDTTSVANAWETLEFDFSNEIANTPAIDFANTYDKAVIFFNFGTDGATAGEKIYYWDDVIFLTSTGLGISMFDNFKYFPNPASDKIFLSADGLIDEVLIFDMLGNRINSFDYDSNSNSLNIELLKSGIYMITIGIENNYKSYRFIKN
ncbi:MAG: T9SS type A sorting domain-containing protein [Cytophagales bacterium]